MSWDEILKDKEFQAQTPEAKMQVAHGYFKDKIASDGEFQSLPDEQKNSVYEHFISTVEPPLSSGREFIGKPLQSAGNAALKSAAFLALGPAAAIDSALGGNRVRDYLGKVIDERTAADVALAPDRRLGAVGRFGRGIADIAPYLTPGIGIPALLARGATEPAVSSVNAGMDSGTATALSAKGLAENAMFTQIPFAGKTLAGSMARGAVINPVIGIAGREAEKSILEATGHPKEAAETSVLPTAEQFGQELGMGALFGAMAGRKRPAAIPGIAEFQGPPHAESWPQQKEIPINPAVSGAPDTSTTPQAAPEASLQQGVEAATPPEQRMPQNEAHRARVQEIINRAMNQNKEIDAQVRAEAVKEADRQLRREAERAETIRRDQEVVPQAGEIPQGSEKAGGDDVHRPLEEPQQSSEVTQKGQEEGTVDQGLLTPEAKEPWLDHVSGFLTAKAGSTDGRIEELKSQRPSGMTLEQAGKFLKDVANGKEPKTDAQKRFVEFARSIQSDLDRTEIPVSDLKEGQEFTRGGEKYTVTNVEDTGFPFEKKVTVKDGQTFNLQGDEKIDVDNGSLGEKQPTLNKFQIASEGMDATDFLMGTMKRQPTWDRGRKTGNTGIEILWPTDDGTGEVTAPKGELPLNLNKGTDLKAPERENKPVSMDELPLGKATNEAADRAKQGGLPLGMFPGNAIEALKPLAKIIGEKGKDAVDAMKDAHEHLVELGKDVMTKGATKYSQFVEGMKQHLGDMWQSFRSAMIKVWQAVKAWNEKLGEFGGSKEGFGYDPSGKSVPKEEPVKEAPKAEVKEEPQTESRVREKVNEAKAKVDEAYKEFSERADKFTDKSEWLKQDVKPAAEAAGAGLKAAQDAYRRTVHPTARSADAHTMGEILIERMGITERLTAGFKAKLDKLTEQYTKSTTWLGKVLDLMQTSSGLATDRIFNRMSKEESNAYMQMADTDISKMKPELQTIAKAVQEMFDSKVKAYNDLGIGTLEDLRKAYMPHIWKTKLSDAQVAEIMSRRPMEGGKSFLHSRVFDDVQAGLNAGYEPISQNPLDLVFLKMHEMDKFINAHSALQEAEKSGIAQVLPASDQIPKGYMDVQKPYGVTYKDSRGINAQALKEMSDLRKSYEKRFGEDDARWSDAAVDQYNDARSKIAAKRIAYRYVVREDVAQVINNYLSSSLYNNKYVGPIFKAYMGAANSLNRFQLGVFAGFHAGFISMDSVTNHGALAIKALVRGDWKKAGTYIREAPLQVYNGVKYGGDIFKAWNGTAEAGKEMPQLVEWMQMAGMRKDMDRRFLGDDTQKMMQAWSNNNKIGAAIRTPLALVEQSSRLIMEYLVPRQKFAAFAEMANAWAEANPGATHEATRIAMQKIGNRVDSRMGQVSYDRLFINNAAKNALQAMVRAPGWTGGTIAELGGGMTDMGRQLTNLVKGKKFEMTDRMAYTLSLAVTTVITNGLLTKLFTGDDPKDKDFLAFRTGGKDEQGNDERFMWPTYGKDVYSYVTNPGKTLLNKTNPLLSLAGEYKQNKDYYGVEVRHPGDNSIVQAGDVIWHGVKAYIPFWMRATNQANQRGDNLPSMLAPLIGIMPASSEYTKTEAQKQASDFLRARTPVAARTREEYEHRQEKYKIEQKFRRGDPEAATLMQKAVSEGKLTQNDVKDIQRTKGLSPLAVNFKRLSPDEALIVYEKASESERKTLSPMLAKKIRDSRAVPGKKSEWMKNYRDLKSGE